jgi:hypothetical protein
MYKLISNKQMMTNKLMTTFPFPAQIVKNWRQPLEGFTQIVENWRQPLDGFIILLLAFEKCESD